MERFKMVSTFTRPQKEKMIRPVNPDWVDLTIGLNYESGIRVRPRLCGGLLYKLRAGRLLFNKHQSARVHAISFAAPVCRAVIKYMAKVQPVLFSITSSRLMPKLLSCTISTLLGLPLLQSLASRCRCQTYRPN
jgi:hypothetical protein